MRITHAFAGDDVASDDKDNRTSAKRAKTRDHGDWGLGKLEMGFLMEANG